ncbi:MAG TPA: VWA domain-containing protein, partial [Myxococcaceae bacterium]
MLASRLMELRQRLDPLQQSAARPSGVMGWALGLMAPGEVDLSFPTIETLDRELDRVGVHTLADAHLLRNLGVRKGRAGKLAEALQQRAGEALQEYEERLRRVERAHRAGEMPPGAKTTLERSFVKLARVVKVADVFASAPGAQPPPFEILPRTSYAWQGRAPTSARMAIAEFLAERARENVDDVLQKRRDLDLAHEMLLRLGAEHDRDRGVVLRREVAEARERTRDVPPVRSLEELVK